MQTVARSSKISEYHKKAGGAAGKKGNRDRRSDRNVLAILLLFIPDLATAQTREQFAQRSKIPCEALIWPNHKRVPQSENELPHPAGWRRAVPSRKAGGEVSSEDIHYSTGKRGRGPEGWDISDFTAARVFVNLLTLIS